MGGVCHPGREAGGRRAMRATRLALGYGEASRLNGAVIRGENASL
jgi:hypothetical protein